MRSDVRDVWRKDCRKTNLCLVACLALVGMTWGEVPKLPGDYEATIAFFEENVYGRRPDLSSFEKRSRIADRECRTGVRAIRRDVTLNTLTPWGETNFTAVALIPSDASRGRVPCFVYILAGEGLALTIQLNDTVVAVL